MSETTETLEPPEHVLPLSAVLMDIAGHAEEFGQSLRSASDAIVAE